MENNADNQKELQEVTGSAKSLDEMKIGVEWESTLEERVFEIVYSLLFDSKEERLAAGENAGNIKTNHINVYYKVDKFEEVKDEIISIINQIGIRPPEDRDRPVSEMPIPLTVLSFNRQQSGNGEEPTIWSNKRNLVMLFATLATRSGALLEEKFTQASDEFIYRMMYQGEPSFRYPEQVEAE